MSSRRSTADSSAGTSPTAAWRRERLLAAGFHPALAAELLRGRDVDLHALLGLVDRGCPPELAARIMAPLDDGPGWPR
jgi:hypothetical protein